MFRLSGGFNPMDGMGQFPFFGSAGSSGIIQSIQSGSITIATSNTTNTATISSVDTSKATIIFGGWQSNNTGNENGQIDQVRVDLTNGTTVTATRNTGSASFTATIYFTVVEFVSAAVESIQVGTVTVSAATSNTATITSVTTTDSVVNYLASTSNSNTATTSRYYPTVELTAATTVTVTKAVSTDSMVTGFSVVEFASGVLNSSTQAFNITIVSANSNTATISSVTTGQTALMFGGYYNSATTSGTFRGRQTLTDGTTVTANRSTSAASTMHVCGTVCEFKAADINNIQRGTITLTGVASNTATITSVDTSKTYVAQLGHSSSDTSIVGTVQRHSSVLTNATTVTSQNNAAATSHISSYEAVEFA